MNTLSWLGGGRFDRGVIAWALASNHLDRRASGRTASPRVYRKSRRRFSPGRSWSAKLAASTSRTRLAATRTWIRCTCRWSQSELKGAAAQGSRLITSIRTNRQQAPRTRLPL